MALLMTAGTPSSSAGSFNPFQSALEAMIQSQTDETITLPLLFGVGSGSLVTFNSMVDPQGQSFSYSAQPGSLYNGQDFTLSVTGSLSADGSRWDWTSSGSVGSSSWSGTGNIVYTNDPPGQQISTDDTPPRKVKDSGGVVHTVEVKSSTTNNFYADGTVTSNSSYVILEDGVPVKDDDTFDDVPPLVPPNIDDMKWNNNSNSMRSSGFNNINTGSGSFAVQTVPEPATWLLLCSGVLGVARSVRREQKRGRS